MAMTTQQMGVLARVGVDRIVKNYNEHAEHLYPQFMGPTFNDHQSYIQVAQISDFSMAGTVNETSGIPFDTWRVVRTKTYAPVMRAIGYQVSEQAKESDLYREAAAPVPKIMLAMDKTKEQVAANILNLGFSTQAEYLGPDGKSLFATDHPQDIGVGRNKASTATAFSISALRSAITDLMNQKSEKGDPFPVMGPFTLVVPPSLSIYAQEVVTATKMPGTPNNEKNVAGGMIEKVVTNPYLTSSTAWFLLPAKKVENPLFFLQRVARKSRQEYDIDHLVYKFAVMEEYIGNFLTWRGTWGTEGA